jgi:hypothetical protein
MWHVMFHPQPEAVNKTETGIGVETWVQTTTTMDTLKIKATDTIYWEIMIIDCGDQRGRIITIMVDPTTVQIVSMKIDHRITPKMG